MSRIESPDMQLIELLRRSDAPSDEDMQRVSDAIGVKLALGVGASTALLAATHSSWATRLGAIGTWAKGLFLVTSLVGVGIGVTWYAKPEALLLGAAKLEQRPALSEQDLGRARAPHSVEAAVPQAEPTKSATQNSESSPSEPEPKLRAKMASRGTPSTLEAELQLVGRAQSALKSGQPNEALRALDEHARRFPSGVLALERSGVRTVALCQAGRLDEGRAAARSYQRLVPNSVLSARIRIACQLSGE